MKSRRKLVISIILVSLSLFCAFSLIKPTGAYYSYYFTVDKMETNVYVQLDGSILINYEIDFTNGAYAHEIDVVDIGFPNKHYDLDSINASIDGIPISDSDILESTVIDIGVEIWLDGNEISAGDSGHLSVNGSNPKMVYGDYDNKSMASVEFSPTWFDESFCSEYDYLEVNLWFPETVNISAEGITKWHHPEHGDPTVGWENDLMYFQWTKTAVPMQQYMFGISFPKDALNSDAVIRWQANPRIIRIVVNVLVWISGISLAVGIVYFIIRYFTVTKKRYYPPKKRTASTTGGLCVCVIYIGIFAAAVLFSTWDSWGDVYAVIGFFIMVIGGFGMLGYFIYRLIRRLGHPYVKPELMIESAGVKKGLSVVEASIIRNTPLNKVIFLIIYGLLKTGHIEIKEVEPLQFNVISEGKESDLKWYHKRFLECVKKSGPEKGLLHESKLRKLLIDLIKRTHRRMKGFNLDATKAYYNNIVNQAWNKVRKLPEKTDIEWDKIKDEYEWLISDDLFEEHSERYFAHRYIYRPPYWYRRYYYYPYYWNRGYYYHYYPTYAPSTGTGPRTMPSQHINIHSLSDSIVRGLENISSKIVNNFQDFANNIVNKVRPVVKSSGGGRSYSGGSGCACACACACAGCACACAGGGR
ncbi:MAG: hypothetical protein GF364_01510 [Candidatus Lokiarchaeota archaeon]|nr:hypothetical protein [Candidatus Lokiarchaeota archaeon]